MKKIIFPLFILLSALAGCNDWLNVRPETQVEASEAFEKEQGFKDVLTGAYINMTSTSLYGRELTFGTVDAYAQLYSAAGAYTGPSTADYDPALFAHIWKQAYFTLSNLNLLIEHLEKADKRMFSGDNFNVIYGEALGLRAFLHFDLLRLFAPSYEAGGADKTGIPYVTLHSYQNTKHSTVSEVMGYILTDLEKAAGMLKESDPIYTGREITASDDNGYLLDREFKFNYYAVRATMARAYLWKGDYTNALSSATEVIEAGKFTWTRKDAIAVVNDYTRDRTFTPEQIFVLHNDDLATSIENILVFSAKFPSQLYRMNTTYQDRIYPYAEDYRKLYQFSNVSSGSTGEKSCTKLWQTDRAGTEEISDGFKKRMPVIRLPEMYLIAAQCDLAAAPGHINTIRENRGIETPFNAAATEEEIREEILQEYLREFLCEGVAWYHYKRINSTTLRGLTGTFNTAKYVFPVPLDEETYGNRPQENEE